MHVYSLGYASVSIMIVIIVIKFLLIGDQQANQSDYSRWYGVSDHRQQASGAGNGERAHKR